jgi:hypothetical protein
VFCHVFLESSFKKPIHISFENFTEKAPNWGFFCVLKGLTIITSELTHIHFIWRLNAMNEELDNIIIASSTQLVTLNTRITQKACKDIDTIRGWLQTTGQLRAITKQAAVNWAIEYACNALCEQIESQDRNEVTSISEPIPKHTEPIPSVLKVVKIRSMPTTAEELKNYYGCK